jgi:glycosyltransferase involved in cell wall biosynthesis
MKTAYVLVSPCKDEGRYIESTLRSIARQTVPPAQWIIVDDGSTDDGMAIVARWREAMPFIKVVTRGASARQVGPGVIRAFNAGLAAVDVDYDFVCKLDVDLELPEHYFEIMLARMDADPRLGTCSGKAYYRDAAGALRSELCGDEASVGMIKFYRRACFEAIGGFETEVGWDGYDCHRARWLGWRAQSWDDPEIRFLHLRPMGSSQKSIYAGRIRHGRGQYLIGAHPLFFLLSTAYRSLRQRPYVLGSLYALYGYLAAAVARERRFGDRDMVRFVQGYQLRALRRGKREAAEWAFRERRRRLEAQAAPPSRGGG